MASNNWSGGPHGSCRQTLPKITTTLTVFLVILGAPTSTCTRGRNKVLSSIGPLEFQDKFSSLGIDLIHIHHVSSPYSQSNITFSKRIQLLLNSDEERSNYLATQVYRKHPSFGMDHRFVSQVFANSIGHYLLQISLGSPKGNYYLVMDTGSDLVWVKCTPYDGFSDGDNTFFNPIKNSFSYEDIACSDYFCRVRSAAKKSCSPKTNLCKYSLTYKDNTQTKGDLAYENFYFDEASRAWTRSFYRLAFGCSRTSKKSDVYGAAGVVGLSRGKLSLVSQMGIYAFSYCFVELRSTTTEKSQLFLNPDLDKAQLKFSYTPMEYPQEFFYSINLTGIDVNDKPINFPAGFDLEAGENGRYVVDTGIIVTRMPSIAYNSFRDTLDKLMPADLKVKGNDPSLDLCYNIAGPKKLIYPKVVFRFRGGLSILLPKENVFVEITLGKIICLAFMASKYDINVVGTILQQNLQILYDIKNNQMGFAYRKCSHPMQWEKASDINKA